MKPDEFNRYCAEVMGYEKYCEEPPPFDVEEYRLNGKFVFCVEEYQPYDDLNQMAEVVEKLLGHKIHCKHAPTISQMYANGMKQAFRDFIISTMETEK